MKKILAFIALFALFATSVNAQVYLIKPGDTLSQIAKDNSTTVTSLAQINGIQDPNKIYAGAPLNITDEGGILGASTGYTPVTDYKSRTTSYITASAATIPVVSTKDTYGKTIDLTLISSTSTVKVYMALEAGTTQYEAIYCTGISSSSWTGCVRGLDFQGGDESASSTLAKQHNAGSSIIITNTGQFYNQYVSVDGRQVIYGAKEFYAYPIISTSTGNPASNREVATKFYVDSVGAGGFTSVNVSSSLGLQAISSGTPNCSTAAACVGIYASSTASANGGFLNFATSTGRLFWDVLAFLTGSWTWTGNQTFSGSVTAGNLKATSTQGLAVTFTATNTTDVVNKAYVDTGLIRNYATGTAAATITAGQALFITSTSTLVATNSSDATSTFHFVGIAETAGAAAAEIRYTKIGGINCSASGLTPGYPHYLNGTAGQFTSTPGTFIAKIGIATSATCIQVLSPYYIRVGSNGITGTGQVTTTVGFYPAKISLVANAAKGATVVMNSFGSQFASWNPTGISGGNSVFAGNADPTWSVQDSGGSSARFAGSVSVKAADYFILSTSAYDGTYSNTTVYWMAESY